MKGSIHCFTKVYDYDNQAKYPTINFNYLPPSASSIIHPHIQIIQDTQPTYLTKHLLEKSKQYYEKNSNYWLDIIQSEKQLKERYIYETEEIAWLASFSPIGKNELTGILKTAKTDITKLNEDEIKAFANGINKAIKALFFGRGARSLNFSIFPGPIGEDHSDYYRINMKIVSRPTLAPNYTADVGFMEMLHKETIAEATPEMIAESIKEFFQEK